MADGTEYDLPVVNLPASGVATINVNTLLAGAPSSIVSHVSTFGSATLYYSGLQTALMAQMAIGSTAISESYMARFTSVMPGSSSVQTLEGLWWARDPGIDGFIALSNAAAQTRNVTVQAVTAAGQVQQAQSFTLAPHTSQLLDLISLLGRQPSGGEAGGLCVEFTGQLGEVNITGGLENRQEGYSAHDSVLTGAYGRHGRILHAGHYRASRHNGWRSRSDDGISGGYNLHSVFGSPQSHC